jgi:hypothetical protein
MFANGLQYLNINRKVCSNEYFINDGIISSWTIVYRCEDGPFFSDLATRDNSEQSSGFQQ